MQLIMSLPTRKRIVLTGTPIQVRDHVTMLHVYTNGLLLQNDLQEFYSIVEFCNPGILGKPLTANLEFTQCTCMPVSKYRFPKLDVRVRCTCVLCRFSWSVSSCVRAAHSGREGAICLC